MTILLITGSREATPDMLDYARRCVDRAKERGFEIICGDAEGVDEAVMQKAHAIGVPCRVYGAYRKIRRRTPSCEVQILAGDYPSRDIVMAQVCDICVAVWNGMSSGTRITFEAARKLDKEVHIRDFSKVQS